MMNKKYSIIYADPPWNYKSERPGHAKNQNNNRGGATKHYKTMGIDDICAMPVADIADDNSILFMWGTWPKLFEAEQVIKAWGFEYKTCAFVWVKTNKRNNTAQESLIPVDNLDLFWGMGRWSRANTEFCLLAVKGKPKKISSGVHQVIYEPIEKHSKKPHETRKRIIELCGDLPRIELFCRDKPDGWDIFGNEVESDIEL